MKSLYCLENLFYAASRLPENAFSLDFHPGAVRIRNRRQTRSFFAVFSRRILLVGRVVMVNAIGVLDVNQLRETFLRQLVKMNGGAYTYITN